TAFILTSMTDMFTMILVFIMNFVEVNAPPESELALPTSSSIEQVEDGVRLTVTSTEVQVNGERVFGLEAGALPSGVVRTGRRIDALYERLSAVGAAQ